MPWYVLALISALFIGFYEISEKKALTKVHSFSFIVAASFIMLVTALPLLWIREIQIVTQFQLLLLSIGCIFTASIYVFAARALRHLDISEYSPMMNLSPLFLLVFSWLFLSEAPSPVSLIGIALVVSGAYFLELNHHDWFGPFRRMKENKYIHFLILALIFGSMSALMDKVIINNGVTADSLFFYKKVIVAIILVIVSQFFYKGHKNVMKVYRSVLPWVILAAVFYNLADYAYFMAVASPTALIALIIPVKRMSAIISTVLGGESMGEKHIFHKAVAAVIMLSGVFFIVQ